MAKIDLDKLICSLAKRKYFSEEKLQDALKEQGLEYKDGEIVEVQKLKFKVGDWVVDEQGDCFIINSIERGFYFTQLSGCCYQTPLDIDLVDNSYHAWTLEDAKDGDVLYSLDSKQSFIFKHRKPNEQAEVYCGINIYGKFFVGNTKDCIITTDKYIPATNALRDLLFKKMKEAGYEWDADKKELKKIRKPLYKVGNIIKYKGHYYYIKEVVKNEERGFHYNLIAVDGGEVISIGPAGEKDIILISNNRFDYEQADIQQKDYSPKEDEELFFGDFRKIDSEDKGKASFANRQLYNRAILKILSDYVEKYPDTRFGQMLCNLDINPHFDQESRETYRNLNETIKKDLL